MKLTVIIMIVSLMQVSAATFGQNVTLKESRMPLEKIFKEIRKQTGYDIFLSAKQVKLSTVINVDFNNVPLKNVIEKVLDGLPLTYSIEQKTIVIKEVDKTLIDRIVDYLATIDVSGKVIDKEGKPLPGATIKIKGTGTIVSANDNGEFSLKNVDDKAVLEISFVGFKTIEIKVAKELGNVSLEVLTGDLDQVEVVNTGYQTIPKERATGSFTLIDNKALNQQVGTNILDRLNGVSAAILFDDSKPKEILGAKKYNFNIRGMSTINGIQDPLIVLDNFPYEGDVNNINPNDIESVTLLKDAAAASIWGTKAGNGVIVITTKKGRFNQKLQVEFNSNVIVSNKPSLSSFSQMSSSDYIDLEKFVFDQGVYDNYDALYPQFNYYPTASKAVEIMLAQKRGSLSSAEATNQLNKLRAIDSRTEYEKYFYQKGINQQYALNLRGGSGNVAYLLSGGYDDGSTALDFKNKRLTLRSENTYKPAKNLQLSLGLLYTNVKTESGKPAFNPSWQPYTSFVDASGTPVSFPTEVRETYKDTIGGGKLLDWKYYPATDYQHTKSFGAVQDIFFNTGLNYKVLDWINIDLRYQYQRGQSEYKINSDVESYEARSQINKFSQFLPGGVVAYNLPFGEIITKRNSVTLSQNFRAQLNIDKTFSRHNISAIFGSEVRKLKISSDANKVYGYNPDLLTFGNVNFQTPYQSIIDGSSYYLESGLGFKGLDNRFLSFFGNAAYTFDNKYILSGSFRNDASNLFGVKTNDKWTPLWSAGVGWNISSEDFFKSRLIKYLKLRTTYGYSGNVDQSKSAVTVIGFVGPNRYNSMPTSLVQQFANSELRWEKVSTLNIGLDFSSKNDVISGTFEIYRKKGEDLFGPSPIDYTTGQVLDVAVRNVANMVGKGFDLSIQTKNVSGKFNWITNAFVSYNTDKITSYYAVNGQVFIPTNGQGINTMVGKPLYSILSYKSSSLDKDGNPQGYLNNKLSTDYRAIANSATSPDSLVFNGQASPKYFGSLGNTFSFMGFSLSASVQFKLGYYFRKTSIRYSALFDGKDMVGYGHSDYSLRWQRPGDELITDVPSFRYPGDGARDDFYYYSQANVEKADHIRLQYVNLAYDLTKIAKKYLPVEKLSLYLNASNLGILWRANKDHLDPEYYGFTYPVKTYAIGLRANF